MHTVPAKLFSTKTAKMEKSGKYGWSSNVLHLAPVTLGSPISSSVELYRSALKTVCPKADVACAAICLNTSGYGRYAFVQRARINKTRYFWENRTGFLAQLENELRRLQNRAVKRGENISVRLNGTSDLAWFNWIDFSKYPNLKFYDYTKVIQFLGKVPGYYQTFSRTATNWDDCLKALAMGFNVAVCFEKLPKSYRGFKVIDGDKHDLRFLDKQGVIVGLKPKGRALRNEKHGFVVRKGEV